MQSNSRKVKNRAQKACCSCCELAFGEFGDRIAEASLPLICRSCRSWRSLSWDMAVKLTLAAKLPARLPVRFDRCTNVVDAAAWYAGSRSLLTRVTHGSARQQPCREALKVSGGTATCKASRALPARDLDLP